MVEQGFAAPEVCKIVQITYRQLDYWARTELVTPSIRDASGSGTQRLYSFQDLVTLRVIKNLLDTGVSLQRVRVAVEHLRDMERAPHRRHPDVRRRWRVRGALARGGRRPAAQRPRGLRHRARPASGATSRRRSPSRRHARAAALQEAHERSNPAPDRDHCRATRSGSPTPPSASSPGCSTSTRSPGTTSRRRSHRPGTARGTPVQRFTPDFFLPEFDLYIEITTLEPEARDEEEPQGAAAARAVSGDPVQGLLPARLPVPGDQVRPRGRVGLNGGGDGEPAVDSHA